MKRYFVEIAFKGTKFHGWQIQKNAVAIQEILNKALSTVLKEPVETLGCGRTDTGVHAKEFFAHFDTLNLPEQDFDNFIYGVNSLMPFDIAIKRVFSVTPNAHARFDAIQRTYQYHLYFQKDPFKTEFGYHLKTRPDITKMNEGAMLIKTYGDFSCFSKTNTNVKNNLCTISKAYWEEVGDEMIFTISANRFLRNMVRAIVGTLLELGKDNISLEDVKRILENKNRSEAGASVPAAGLYLTKVQYPFLK